MRIEIDSLAKLKRILSTPGLTIRVLKHWQPNLENTTRTPTKVQTNGYWFDGPDRTGKVVRMWAELPKASQMEFNQDGSVTFYPGQEKNWTLAFEIPEEEISEHGNVNG